MNLAARTRFTAPSLLRIAPVIGALVLAGPAAAQTVIGGNGSSDVVVDYSVLDALGPPPNIPQLLMPPGSRAFPPPAPGAPMPRFPVVNNGGSTAGNGQIVLKPPTQTTRRRSAVRSKPAPTKKPAATAPPKVATRAPAPPPPPPAPVAAPKAPPAPPPMAAPAPPPPPAVPEPPKMAAREPAPPPLPPAPTMTAKEPPAPPPMTEPKAAPAPPPPAPPTTVASLPPATGAIAPGQSVRIGFQPGSAKLEADASAQLKRVADGMRADDQLRIQLLAYAGGASDTASQARRLSLSRALAARSFLLGEKVRSTRIDVRALGNKSEGGPPDRIDIIVTKR